MEKEQARRWRGGASSADDGDDVSRGVSTLLSRFRQALVKLSTALDAAGIWYHMELVGGICPPLGYGFDLTHVMSIMAGFLAI